ncbi:hypothetical protein G6F42_012985 [Rhizopus arrhizus]|nr:hypothetical protein G6F42_012985 [Rhizopus arrhizus]
MGGIKTFFFGDGVQLLPFQQKEGKIWKSEIFNTVLCYSLQNPVRQQGVCFIDIHNKVRNYESDESVVSFLNERSFHKSQVPLSCLRLYMTRQRFARANEKDFAEFPGEGQESQTYDTYVVIQGRNSQSFLPSPMRFIKHKVQQSTVWESIWIKAEELAFFLALKRLTTSKESLVPT